MTNPLGVLLAVSGMDTALNVLVFSCICLFFSRYKFKRPFQLGLLLGLFFLTRPDALTLLLVIIFISLLHTYFKFRRARSSAALSLYAKAIFSMLRGAAFVSVPWVILVYIYTHHLVPPTGIGKLLERLPSEHGLTYPQFLGLDIISRLRLAMQNVVDLFNIKRGGIVILPYFLIFTVGTLLATLFKKGRQLFYGNGDILGLLLIYSMAVLFIPSFLFPLPMPRYIATIIPASIAGSFFLGGCLVIPKLEAKTTGSRLSRLRKIVTATLLIIFVGVGIGSLLVAYKAYIPHARAQQVRRTIGEWIRENTPSNASVAMEPIGEIGFYSERKIVDLGGLINSDIWKYIKNGYGNTDGMFEFLKEHHVDFLVDRPPEIPWSLNRTVQKYSTHFVLLATFGSDKDTHLIYKFQ